MRRARSSGSVARRAVARLLAAVLVLGLAAPALAAGPVALQDQLVALGQWQLRGGRLQLVVPLAEALTPKQRAMIDGGFTTLSQLTLRTPRPGTDEEDDDPSRVVASVRCTVKFDAWEETYDVARLDESEAHAVTVKTYPEYGELCLKAAVAEPALVARLAEAGGTLFATLVVKQTSAEEAAKIKEWLIQQQSGVMQSLFSHMLGELTLNQTLQVRISVPPRPHGAVTPLTPAGEPPREPAARGGPGSRPKSPRGQKG